MSEVFEEELPQKTEIELLRERADRMGVKYHPTIGKDKLKEKIDLKLSGAVEPIEQVQQRPKGETPIQRKARLRKESARLVRVRVTCMNPNKKEWEGEIFTASNSVVGTFKKYVPFNAEDGWHIPTIILKQIQERKCQIFQTVKNSRGQKMRKGKLVKEFAVEILPPLTSSELKELAQQQAISHSID
jgi:hypothetical protein